MWQAVLTIALGFVFTVLIGGAWASYLQQRSWQHQNDSRHADEERQRADEVCTGLSVQLDKCCYRTRVLIRTITNKAPGDAVTDEVREVWRDYDEVIRDWNDQLKTRMATVGTHFGSDILEALKIISQQVESMDRTVGALRNGVGDAAKLFPQVDLIAENVYRLSGKMMMRIRDGKVGVLAPMPLTTGDLQVK